MSIRLYCFAALIALALGTRAETTTWADMLSGKVVPFTMQVKDLTGEWKKLHTSGQADDTVDQLQQLSMMRAGISQRNDIVTRGQTVTIGGETYLVAYCPPEKIEDLRARYVFEEQPTEPTTPDTVLNLALLHLPSCGSLQDIQPYDAVAVQTPESPMTPARQRASRNVSLNNLRQIVLAIQMQAQDNDSKLPLMNGVSALKALSLSPTTLKEPISKLYYTLNAALSGRAITSFTSPAQELVAAYETVPGPDGMRIAAFLDGHVQMLDEDDWTAAKAKSGIR